MGIFIRKQHYRHRSEGMLITSPVTTTVFSLGVLRWPGPVRTLPISTPLHEVTVPLLPKPSFSWPCMALCRFARLIFRLVLESTSKSAKEAAGNANKQVIRHKLVIFFMSIPRLRLGKCLAKAHLVRIKGHISVQSPAWHFVYGCCHLHSE